MINKPWKKAIRSQYEQLMANWFKEGNYEPGKEVTVSLEELVEIVEDAYHSINMANNTGKKFIRNSFDMCGLNPWSNDMHAYHKHLGSLSENGIYKSLLEKNSDRDISGKSNISHILTRLQ